MKEYNMICSFNVLTIRRYIVADMKGDLNELESVDEGSQVGGAVIPEMSFKGMVCHCFCI